MRNTKSTLSRESIGRDYDSKTIVVSKTHVGKFRTKNTMNSTTTNLDKNGNVLSNGSTISKSTSVSATSGIIGGAFATIFGALILINLFNLLMGNTDFRGFEWFLNVLSNAPKIPIDWLTTWSKTSLDASSWGAFEFLGNFINKFNDLLTTIAFIGVGAVNIITFVIYFLIEFLFMGI